MNQNYSRTKGEQFALNVDGKPSLLLSSKTNNNSKEQQRYYRSNVMDKQVLSPMNELLIICKEYLTYQHQTHKFKRTQT